MIYKTYKNDIKIANIVLKDLQIFPKDFSIKSDDNKLYPMSNKFWNKFLKDSEYENFKTVSILDKYVPDYKFNFTNVKQGLYLLKFPDMYGMIISLSAKAKYNLETLLNLDIVYDSITQIDPETFSFGFSVNKNDYKTIARHEVKLNLSQLFNISKKLLKNNKEPTVEEIAKEMEVFFKCLKNLKHKSTMKITWSSAAYIN